MWRNKDEITSFAPGITVNFAPLSSNAAEFDLGHSGARADYTVLHLDVSHQHPLPWGTQFYVHVTGQEAMEPLLTGEQLSIGGAQTVRGYLESETLGDYGAFGQMEFRSPEVNAPKWGVGGVRLFAFYDTGEVWSRQTPAGERVTTGLASTGFGLRGSLFKDFSADLDASQVLVSGPNTHAGNRKFLFRLIGGF